MAQKPRLRRFPNLGRIKGDRAGCTARYPSPGHPEEGGGGGTGEPSSTANRPTASRQGFLNGVNRGRGAICKVVEFVWITAIAIASAKPEKTRLGGGILSASLEITMNAQIALRGG